MEKRFRIEKNKRFSKSWLWAYQEALYRRFGPKSWQEKEVPFYLTSNPFIANSYAHLVLGFLKDCIASKKPSFLDPLEPFYIFDLGAGSGRFGWFFLRSFLSFLNVLPFPINIRYIMTEMVEKNLLFLVNHPSLKPYIKKGVLDFAMYHHQDSKELKLLVKGEKILSPTTVKNPIVLLANYFFDTLPQDFFRVRREILEEGRVTIYSREEKSKILEMDPSLLEQLDLSFRYFPIEKKEEVFPEDLNLYSTLKGYAKNFKNSSFLWPTGAFQTLHFFSSLSQKSLFLLAGDQGVATKKEVEKLGKPRIDKHATFSLSVNYDALSFYIQKSGGKSWITSFPRSKFVVFSGVLGRLPSKLHETSLSFEEHLDAFEPLDYFEVTQKNGEAFKPRFEKLFSLLKLGRFDPVLFHQMFDSFRLMIPELSSVNRTLLLKAILLVFGQFYPVGAQEGLFVMNLGVLCFELKKFKDALFFFHEALKIGGEHPLILKNLSLCHRQLKKS